MLSENDKIVVLLRAACDPKIPGGVARSGFGVRARELRTLLNPADRTALSFALGLKAQRGVQVIAVSYGDNGEKLLNEIGCLDVDRCITLKGFSPTGSDAMDEGILLAGLAQRLSPRLFCTGNRMVDRGAAMGVPLAAALLGRPCVHGVLSEEAVTIGEETITLLRKSDRGSRQRVKAPLPCFLLIEQATQPEIQAETVAQLLDGLDREIETWSRTDLCLTDSAVPRKRSYTSWEGTDRLRPRAVAVTTPDPALPAFERILSLLEGGIKSRQGKLRFLDAEQTASHLFNTVRQAMTDQGTR